jgi:hypothetical protein
MADSWRDEGGEENAKCYETISYVFVDANTHGESGWIGPCGAAHGVMPAGDSVGAGK